MNTDNNKDYLDGLLFAAAKGAGKAEIEEYNSGPSAGASSDALSKIMARIDNGSKEPVKVKKGGRLSLKRKFIIAASAAVFVCLMAVGVIAGLVKNTAPVIISNVANKPVLSYELTGIKSGSKVTDKVPDILAESYTEGEAKELSDGKSTVYTKGDEQITYTVRVLDADYSLELGNSSTECVEILVSGKYYGCMAVTDIGGKKRSVVAWNDGKYAYELCGMTDGDVLVGIAQSMY